MLQFNLVVFDRDGESYSINRWGRKNSNYPAMNEASLALERAGVESAEILAELYAIDDGKPLMLPKFIHYFKGHEPGTLNKIFLGIFDIWRINGNRVRESYAWKLEEAGRWFEGCRWVHVLPWRRVHSIEDLEQMRAEYVWEIGYEGLILRNGLGIFKWKPTLDMDAVIIGINKREKLAEKKVTSLKLALLTEEAFGTNGFCFVEVGDVASGINFSLREELYQLMEFKVGEDNDTIFVEPMVVVHIEFNDMYMDTTNRVFTFGQNQVGDLAGKFREVGTKKLIRLRHPKLRGFRKDKIVSLKDVGLNQVPERKVGA
jgi:ATP-dependent DNA ligase